MEMYKRDNIFVRLIKSLYDIKSFSKYMFDGIGKALLYALIFTLIIGGVKGIATTCRISKTINEAIEILSEDKYQFEVKDGMLELMSSPLKFNDNNTLIYFDEDKTIDNINDLKGLTVNADVYMLVLKDGIYLNSNNQDVLGEEKITYKELPIDKNDKIDNGHIIDFIQSLKITILIMTMIISLISTLVSYIIIGLLATLFSLLTSKLLGLNLRFSHIFALTMYTGTLPNILITIFNLFSPMVSLETAAIVGILLLNYVVLKNMRKTV